jgi:hypothetical protein
VREKNLPFDLERGRVAESVCVEREREENKKQRGSEKKWQGSLKDWEGVGS